MCYLISVADYQVNSQIKEKPADRLDIRKGSDIGNKQKDSKREEKTEQ